MIRWIRDMCQFKNVGVAGPDSVSRFLDGKTDDEDVSAPERVRVCCEVWEPRNFPHDFSEYININFYSTNGGKL